MLSKSHQLWTKLRLNFIASMSIWKSARVSDGFWCAFFLFAIWPGECRKNATRNERWKKWWRWEKEKNLLWDCSSYSVHWRVRGSNDWISRTVHAKRVPAYYSRYSGFIHLYLHASLSHGLEEVEKKVQTMRRTERKRVREGDSVEWCFRVGKSTKRQMRRYQNEKWPISKNIYFRISCADAKLYCLSVANFIRYC